MKIAITVIKNEMHWKHVQIQKKIDICEVKLSMDVLVRIHCWGTKVYIFESSCLLFGAFGTQMIFHAYRLPALDSPCLFGDFETMLSVLMPSALKYWTSQNTPISIMHLPLSPKSVGILFRNSHIKAVCLQWYTQVTWLYEV